LPRITTLSVTRDDIIKAALRKLDVLGEGETPTAEDYTNCSFGLNLLLKAWALEGTFLWKTTELTLPLVSGTVSYQIGDTATGTGALVTNRPIKLIDACFVRDANSNDVPVTLLSRQEYNALGNKTTSGTVTQIFYDPQLTNGVLKVFGKPADSLSSLHLVAQIPIYDFSSGSETLDLPQEGYQAAVYGLADEMMDEYPKPSAVTIQRITGKAAQFKEQLTSFSQEEASVFFMPNSSSFR